MRFIKAVLRANGEDRCASASNEPVMTRFPADMEMPAISAPATVAHLDLRAGAANLLAHKFIHSLGVRPGFAFDLVLPDGALLKVGTRTPGFTVRFRSESALVSTLTRGHIGLLEAYFDQEVDVEGDLGAAFAAAMASGFDLQNRLPNRAENALHEWRHSNRSFGQAKANARAFRLPRRPHSSSSSRVRSASCRYGPARSANRR
ncbi:MAG: hypothetical protein ABI641_15645 [Caldimonas sp.]